MNEFKEIWEAFKQEWSEQPVSEYMEWGFSKNKYVVDDCGYLYISKNGGDFEKVDGIFNSQEEAMMAAYLMETWDE